MRSKGRGGLMKESIALTLFKYEIDTTGYWTVQI